MSNRAIFIVPGSMAIVALVLCALVAFAPSGSANPPDEPNQWPNKAAETLNDAVQAIQNDHKRLRARIEALEALPTVKREMEARDAAARAERAARDRPAFEPPTMGR